MFGKVEQDAHQTPLSLQGPFTVLVKALFECKLTVTLFRIPIEYGIHSIYGLGTIQGLYFCEGLAFDTQQRAHCMFQPRIIC